MNRTYRYTAVAATMTLLCGVAKTQDNPGAASNRTSETGSQYRPQISTDEDGEAVIGMAMTESQLQSRPEFEDWRDAVSTNPIHVAELQILTRNVAYLSGRVRSAAGRPAVGQFFARVRCVR